MTPAGTPAPQVGGTVSTAAELDALPVGSVVRNESRAIAAERLNDVHGAAIGNPNPFPWSDFWSPGSRLTVLFRPDAPQPAATRNAEFPVGDDAVERAARAIEPDAWSEMDEMAWFHEYGQDSVNEATADRNRRKHTSLVKARAALAAARAGEAEGDADRLSQTHADALATLESLANRMDEFAYDEMRSVLEDGVLLRDEDGMPKHQGRARAASAGAEADWEALVKAAPLPWTMSPAAHGNPTNGPDHHVVRDATGATVAETDYSEFGSMLADFLVLAARGAAAPTVTAEHLAAFLTDRGGVDWLAVPPEEYAEEIIGFLADPGEVNP